jgi:hypothetical protein
MTISTNQQVDYLWKKLGYGLTKTDTPANKLAFNESIASPLLLRGDKVWQESSSIPAVIPSSSSAQVTVYKDLLSNTIECTSDITATANRTWKTGLTDWIPVEFGSTYLVKVYLDTTGSITAQTTGTQLFQAGAGNSDEWFFDYQSGVLHFIGDNLPSQTFTGKSIFVSGARYTGQFGVGSAPGQDANIANLTVVDTTISTVNTGANITIDTTGSGIFKIDATNGFIVPVGNAGDRPVSPATGTLRFNTDSSKLEYWDGAQWMSAAELATNIATQVITPDGLTTTFTLNSTTTNDGCVVAINGVTQIPGLAFNISADEITFTEIPQTTDIIMIKIFTVTSISSGSVTSITAGAGIDITATTGDITISATGSTSVDTVVSQGAGTSVDTSPVAILTFPVTQYTSGKLLIQATASGEVTMFDTNFVQNTTNCSVAISTISSNSDLGEITANISASNVSFYFTGFNSGNLVKVLKLYLV